MTVRLSVRWLMTLALVAFTITVSIVPGFARPGDTSFSWLVAATPGTVQKVMHFVVYGALAWLWVWSLENLSSQRARFVVAFLFCVALGALLEWWQTFVPGRFGMLIDVFLNMAGVTAGLLLARLSLTRESA